MLDSIPWNDLTTSSSREAAESFSQVVFDYLVIGGGTAGLPIAARLSENPQVKVGLIEAGLLHHGDSLIDVPGYTAMSSGNPKYDWNFSTTPQSQGNDRVIPVPRGRMLGGSSGLNFLAWDRGSKLEYDAWKILSDADGWNWDNILPHFHESESAASYPQDPYPSMSQSKTHVTNPGHSEPHGSSGPVKVSYGSECNDIISHYVKGWNEMGILTNANPYGGEKNGVYNTMSSIDQDTGARSDAAKAYLYPAANRKNLIILTAARATKLVFDDRLDSQGKLVATGVSFELGGTVFQAVASKEVIISAGVVQTPQLLELSGIGDPKLLENLGIKTLVDLPGVGENLHDHIFAPMQFLVKPGIRTSDEMRINADFAAEHKTLYESAKKGWLTYSDTTVVFLPLQSSADKEFFNSKLQLLEESIQRGGLTPLQKAQYEIQVAWMKGGEVPDIEIALFSKGLVMPEPDKSYFVVMAGIQHPLSRGSVHINTADPLVAPVIDPRYLSHKFDLDMLTAGYRLIEKFAETKPMKKIIDSVSFPPSPLVSDGELSGYIRATFASGSHLMGTCAMARRELGGVVDSHLKVYGTSNVRVADTSIIPIPIAAHIQATAYAIGEKAANLIKQDN